MSQLQVKGEEASPNSKITCKYLQVTALLKADWCSVVVSWLAAAQNFVPTLGRCIYILIYQYAHFVLMLLGCSKVAVLAVCRDVG